MRASRTFLPPHRYGIAIDVIAIVANLFLFPLMLGRVSGLFDNAFAEDGRGFHTLAGLMMFLLAARLFGLYLKRFPLQTHREEEGQTSFPFYFFVFNVGVFILNAAFVVVFLSAVAGSLGLVETNYNGTPKDSPWLTGVGLIFMIAVLATEIYLLYRLSRPLNDREKELRKNGNWMFDWRGELAADFGLFSYMMVWQVFYNVTVQTFMTSHDGSELSLENKIFSSVFLVFVFLIFYVSPRTVFLIEDRKYLGTWLLIFGVYLSSVLRYW